MNTDTPTTDQWETYCDECYYHMWRLRRKTERGWHDGFHVHTGAEAKGLCDLLNNLGRELAEARESLEFQKKLNAELNKRESQTYHELIAVTKERDEAREALKTGGMLNIIDRAAHGRAAAIRERDEARAEMIRWMSIAEGRGHTDETLSNQ